MDARSSVIDAFRGIAILAVVVFHYTVRWAPPVDTTDYYSYGIVFPNWLNVGDYGVHLFFAISGLVITMTLLRSRDVWEFAARRFARIYPAFIVAAVVTFLALQYGPEPFRLTLWDLVSNFIIDARLLGGHPIDGAYWSLVVEVKFYAIVFLMRVVLGERFWLGLLVFAVASSLLLQFDVRIAREAMLAPYWPFFLVGIAGWYWIFGGQRNIAAVLFAASVGLYLVTYTLNHKSPAPSALIDAFIVLTVTAMLLTLKFWPTVQVPVLAPIGRVSYSLYLFHQHLGVTLIGVLTARGVWALPAMLTVTLAMIALAALSFRYVEVPGGKLAMRLCTQLTERLKTAMSTRARARERLSATERRHAGG